MECWQRQLRLTKRVTKLGNTNKINQRTNSIRTESELRTSYGQLYNPNKKHEKPCGSSAPVSQCTPEEDGITMLRPKKWLGWLEQSHNLRSFSCCQAAVRCWHERKGPAGSKPIYILTNHFEQQRLWVKSMVFACLNAASILTLDIVHSDDLQHSRKDLRIGEDR